MKEDTSLTIALLKEEKRKIEKKCQGLESILLDSPGHIYWKDKAGIYLGCNTAQAISFGYTSPDDVIGKTDYDWLPKQQADALSALDQEVIKTGEIKIREELSTLADGTIATFLSKKKPLRDNEGNIIGVVGVSVDITAKKEKEKAIYQNFKLAEKQYQQAETFASALAHELRTPIAGINAGANGLIKFLPKLVAGFNKAQENNQLDDENFIPRQKLSLLASVGERIKKQAAYANLFIDMSLKNIRHKSIDNSQFARLSIKDTVNDMLERYPLDEQEQQQIIWKPDQFEDFMYWGDQTLTIHVLFNLLKNSLYYIRYQRDAIIKIELQQSTKGNTLVFTDTGKGISADILPNIFKAFYTKRGSGSGVGLAFCKMVMTTYGGDIRCESEEGKYTTFILDFPVLNT